MEPLWKNSDWQSSNESAHFKKKVRLLAQKSRSKARNLQKRCRMEPQKLIETAPGPLGSPGIPWARNAAGAAAEF